MKPSSKDSVVFMALALLGILIMWALRLTAKVTVWVCREIWTLGRDIRTPPMKEKGSALRTAVRAAPEGMTESRPIQKKDFRVAKQIINVGLVPAVGNLHLRVYRDTLTVGRELILIEPKLKSLLQGRRFTFPDVTFDPKVGFDEIIDETVELAQKLINERGNQRVQRRMAKAKQPEVQSLAASKLNKPEPSDAKPASKESGSAAPGKQPQVRTMSVNEAPAPIKTWNYAPRPKEGVTFEGLLVWSGTKRFAPKDRPVYESFEAKIRLTDGIEIPLRGAELERELISQGVSVGDRVAITPMGKIPVELADGQTGTKNLYRVQPIGSLN